MALTLSGGPSASTSIPVDDDLEVRLNGTAFFTDNDELAQNLPPISFTAAFGDQLRVIASNSTVFGGNETIGPLYLHCDANGATQVLDTVGFSGTGAPGNVFYDQTFTIDFAAPQNQVTVTKLVVGPVPSDSSFRVHPSCTGTAAPLDIFFDAAGNVTNSGGPNTFSVPAGTTCDFVETQTGGAAVSFGCTKNNADSQTTCTNDHSVSFGDTISGSVTIKVTNTYQSPTTTTTTTAPAVVASPAFTG